MWANKIFLHVLFWFMLFFAANLMAEQSYEGLKRAVVQVITGNQSGSGFIFKITDDFVYILTAAHVLNFDTEPKVKFFKHEKKFVAEVIKRADEENIDMAVLLLDKEKSDLPANLVSLSLSSEFNFLKDTDWVDIIGIPNETNSWGNFKRKVVKAGSFKVTLEQELTDGNSGAPLLKNNQVVGLVGKSKEPFLYAIPITIIQLFLSEVVDLEKQTDSKKSKELIYIISDDELLDILKTLLPAQFREVMHKFGAPESYFTVNSPQINRAIDLINYAKSRDELYKLKEIVKNVKWGGSSSNKKNKTALNAVIDKINNGKKLVNSDFRVLTDDINILVTKIQRGKILTIAEYQSLMDLYEPNNIVIDKVEDSEKARHFYYAGVFNTYKGRAFYNKAIVSFSKCLTMADVEVARSCSYEIEKLEMKTKNFLLLNTPYITNAFNMPSLYETTYETPIDKIISYKILILRKKSKYLNKEALLKKYNELKPWISGESESSKLNMSNLNDVLAGFYLEKYCFNKGKKQELDEAYKLLQESIENRLDRSTETGLKNKLMMFALSLNNIAAIYYCRNDYSFSTELLEGALFFIHSIKDMDIKMKKENIALLNYNLGNVLYKKKNYAQAIKFYERLKGEKNLFLFAYANLQLAYANANLESPQYEKAVINITVAFKVYKVLTKRISNFMAKENFKPLDDMLKINQKLKNKFENPKVQKFKNALQKWEDTKKDKKDFENFKEEKRKLRS